MARLVRGVLPLVGLLVSVPAAADDEKVRGPADQLVVEGGAGYSAGLFTAIQGHDPHVAHGAAFHFGLGWAFSVKNSQSLGAELFADGAFDAAGIVGPNSTGRIAPRFGVAGVLWGDVAHLRLGGGWASSHYEGGTYAGPSLVFAAGWHIKLMPSLTTWKRPVLIIEVIPSFDFLKANDETLNRWNLAAVVGFAAY